MYQVSLRLLEQPSIDLAVRLKGTTLVTPTFTRVHLNHERSSMPKAHNIGSLFVQLTNFPYEWGSKVIVRGWTQEIETPFRTSKPFIVRLPKYKALVFGRWSGMKSEEEALSGALEARDASYEDFKEEAGWTPAPDSDRETSSHNLISRFDFMDGAIDVYNWQTYHQLATEPDPSGS